MQNVRIIEIPKMKVVTSGPIYTMEAFEAFNQWFTEYHNSLSCELTPRDFMWYNEIKQATEWIYALPAGAKEEDCGGYEVKEFSFGLYAVAVCIDADLDKAEDWKRTQEEIKQWVNSSELFELATPDNDPIERFNMFHIVTPGWLQEKGFCLEDMYVPIVLKK